MTWTRRAALGALAAQPATIAPAAFAEPAPHLVAVAPPPAPPEDPAVAAFRTWSAAVERLTGQSDGADLRPAGEYERLCAVEWAALGDLCDTRATTAEGLRCQLLAALHVFELGDHRVTLPAPENLVSTWADRMDARLFASILSGVQRIASA
ncbi:MAG: hypothetical protein AAF192_11905 [Pseudomonadota bacterium]